MKLVEHVIAYITKGLQLKEVPKIYRSAKQFRKFEVSENLFYFVHKTGYVLLGKTLMTATRPHRDVLRDMANWESLMDGPNKMKS